MSSSIQTKEAKGLGATMVTPLQNLSEKLYEVIFLF